MAKKVTLQKKINAEVVTLFPQTSAENVMYDADTTVKDMIDALVLELNTLEDILSIDSVYIKSEDGKTLLDDGSGTNLTAVASLIANEESSGS